jgi:hypothetical protein
MLEIGVENVALEGQAQFLAVPFDLDQACRLELLDVVGQGRGTDPMRILRSAATNSLSSVSFKSETAQCDIPSRTQ